MSAPIPTTLTDPHIVRGRLLQARAIRAAFAALFRWRFRRSSGPVVRPAHTAC